MSECKVIQGDCLEVLRGLEDNSIDAVVCDPPYGLSNTKPAQVADVLKAWVTGDDNVVPEARGFMGKSWDGFVPPPAVWKECMRVLKPGGHMAVFAGARTQDLMGLSIRLAGFEIRDTLGWIYGSGFPKSHDIGKAIDKQRNDKQETLAVTSRLSELASAAGISRKDVDSHMGTSDMGGWWLSTLPHRCVVPSVENWAKLRDFIPGAHELDTEVWRLNGRKGTPGEAWEKREVTQHAAGESVRVGAISFDQRSSKERERRDIPATSDAARWDGWGTALKPAIEPIILARKPLVGTVAGNVLAWGVGGLNIDASRVGIDDGERDVIDSRSGASANNKSVTCYGDGLGQRKEEGLFKSHASGRFPANVLLDEHAAAEMDKQSGVLKSGERKPTLNTAKSQGVCYGSFAVDNPNYHPPSEGGASRFFPVFKSEEETPETKGRFPANVLLDEHAAKEMDEQSGITKSTGGKATHDRTPAYDGGWDNPGSNVGGLGDTGGASRFFPVFKYQAKAPKRERPVIEREDGSKIQHPTVKPLTLLEWLVTLITPPGGVVLDPFAGSGTTLEAARNKGFDAIGIEREADYIQLIEQRLNT